MPSELRDNAATADLDAAARRVANWGVTHPGQPLVLAESCTGGLVAASLTAIPGISQYFCGSLVTYRESAKIDWLDLDPVFIDRYSAVSQEVTDLMALRALALTPEAHWSAATTGHLGPGVATELDGRIYLSVSRRQADRGAPELVARRTIQLPSQPRIERQRLAAQRLLEFILEQLEAASSGP